jgi:Flp pilus assembly protein TadG
MMRARDDTGARRRCDAGTITAVEMLGVVAFGLVALLFLGYLGRLHAAAIQVQNAAQAAARAASQARGAGDAEFASSSAVAASALRSRCNAALSTNVSWSPSPTGGWQGGSVTVTISCTVANDELAGVWAPGARTIVASDTQPIDRYQR